MHSKHSKKGVKHYPGEYSIYHYRTSCKNHYIRNKSLENLGAFLCSAVYDIGNQHFSSHAPFLYIFSLLIKVY